MRAFTGLELFNVLVTSWRILGHLGDVLERPRKELLGFLHVKTLVLTVLHEMGFSAASCRLFLKVETLPPLGLSWFLSYHLRYRHCRFLVVCLLRAPEWRIQKTEWRKPFARQFPRQPPDEVRKTSEDRSTGVVLSDILDSRAIRFSSTPQCCRPRSTSSTSGESSEASTTRNR